MADRRTPRLIRVGEFERVGCKCKHKDCALRTSCVLSLQQLRDAAHMPKLEPEIITAETPAQIRVYCHDYKEEQKEPDASVQAVD